MPSLLICDANSSINYLHITTLNVKWYDCFIPIFCRLTMNIFRFSVGRHLDLIAYSTTSLNQTVSKLQPSISKYNLVSPEFITSWKHIGAPSIIVYFKSSTYINCWSYQYFSPFCSLTIIYSGSRINCNSYRLFLTLDPLSLKNLVNWELNVSKMLSSSILI